jgi:hypothetical protein
MSIKHHFTTVFTPEEDLSLLSPTVNLNTMVVYTVHVMVYLMTLLIAHLLGHSDGEEKLIKCLC